MQGAGRRGLWDVVVVIEAKRRALLALMEGWEDGNTWIEGSSFERVGAVRESMQNERSCPRLRKTGPLWMMMGIHGKKL